MAELKENSPVYGYCHKQRVIKCQSVCVTWFGFRKGKAGNFCCQIRAISSYLINLLNTRDIKSPMKHCQVEVQKEYIWKLFSNHKEIS